MKKKSSVLLIANPVSGGGKAKLVLPKIEAVFRKANIKLDVSLTGKQGDATAFAKKAAGKYNVVIAAGGDGTINEVANGLAKSRTEMGIIPFGTENVLIREFGIPRNPVLAAKAIINGKAKTIDLGRANKRYFMMVAGIGIDAKVASEVEPSIKKILGSGAYYLKMIETLLIYKPSKLSIKIDGKKEEGFFVVVGNSKYYGGGFEFTPHADISDGYLNVCVFKKKDLMNMLKYAAAITVKKHVNFTDVCYGKAKKIKIKSEEHPVLAHVDCELIGTTPIKIEVCPKALRVICPRP